MAHRSLPSTPLPTLALDLSSLFIAFAPQSLPALPQQPPFRLLDRLLHVDVPAGVLWANKRLTANDALWPGDAQPWQAGRPEDQPSWTFPSLLLIESLSQAAACFNILAAAESHAALPTSAEEAQPVAGADGTHLGFLVSVSDFRFPADRQAGASIGDTLVLHVQKQESLGALVAFSAQAFCLPSAEPVIAALDAPRTLPLGTRSVGQGRLLFAVTSK